MRGMRLFVDILKAFAMKLLAFFVAFPAVAAVAVIVLVLFWRWQFRPADRKRTEMLLAATLLAVPAAAACEAVTNWLSMLRPLKYDLYIYRLDGLLGFQPSFFLGRIAARHLWLEILLNVAYGLLPCAMLAVWAAYLWKRADESGTVLLTFVANLFLAVPIYLLIPVCGPAFAFHSFPLSPGPVIPHLLAIHAPPNGVPSVHTSTALLVLWFARKWRFGTIAASIYLALIVFSTLASGQHYLFDLLTAVPYAMAVYALSALPFKSINAGRMPDLQQQRSTS